MSYADWFWHYVSPGMVAVATIWSVLVWCFASIDLGVRVLIPRYWARPARAAAAATMPVTLPSFAATRGLLAILFSV